MSRRKRLALLVGVGCLLIGGLCAFRAWRASVMRDPEWILNRGIALRGYMGEVILTHEIAASLIDAGVPPDRLIEVYLRSESYLARQRVLSIVAAFGDRSALSPLQKLFEETQDPSLRARIIITIGWLGDERSLEMLKATAESSDDLGVASCAAEAISLITGKPAKYREPGGDWKTREPYDDHVEVLGQLRNARAVFERTGRTVEYQNIWTHRKEMYRPDALARARRAAALGQEPREESGK